jgi:hypothetical protein
VESDCVRTIDPDLVAAQLWSTLHGFIMHELGGYFATLAEPASEVLVPMCVNLIDGLGVDRKSAESSAATATAGRTRSLGVGRRKARR